MNFAIYRNHPHRTIAIHRKTCNRLRQHGGVSATVPPTGEYVDGLPTLTDARVEASKDARYSVRYCSYCAPEEAGFGSKARSPREF